MIDSGNGPTSWLLVLAKTSLPCLGPFPFIPLDQLAESKVLCKSKNGFIGGLIDQREDEAVDKLHAPILFAGQHCLAIKAYYFQQTAKQNQSN